MLLPFKDGIESTYKLLEAVESLGSSTAVNECAFSALSRIDTVRRMAMTDQRLCNLAFLAFEKNRISSIKDFDDKILRKFNEKNRKIQLF